jgi:predicted phage terminase large subunit-like protein
MMTSEQAVVNAILRRNLVSFSRRCFTTLNPGKIFVPNWYHEAVAYPLERVRAGEIRLLIINLPPRTLKSLMCSVAFPAYVLGHDPTKRIIVPSYGNELAIKLANDCRVILQSPWYQRLFPRTRISRMKNSETEVTTTLHGYRLATSVGGSLTGRGGDIIIIDESLKPQDAYSQSKRQAVNDWFVDTVLSRLDDQRTGTIIIVMQRLHVDDLVGALLRVSGNDPVVLSLPAIAERDEQIEIGKNDYHFRREGDLLDPERLPREVLDVIKAHQGPDVFAAQYQQNPVPPGGNMIKREWIRRYETLPARTSSTYVLQSYDTASKEGEQNSWSVCTTWHVREGNYYLADVLRARFDYPTLEAQALAHAQHHKPTCILVEATGVGPALASKLRGRGFRVIEVQVEHNKETRMSVQSGKFASGRVLFPNGAPWLNDLLDELCAFPGSRFDDQVDSVSQALAHEIKTSYWTEKSLRGFDNLVNGLAFDAYFGRLTGRPW